MDEEYNIKNLIGQDIEQPIEIEDDIDILDDSYLLSKQIGDGATANVFLAKSTKDNSTCAIKILKNENNESYRTNYKYFLREMEMLKKIQHRNIISIIGGKSGGIIKKSDCSLERVDYLDLELAENGELFDYMYFVRKGFGEDYGRYLFKQMVNGLNACHQAGVVHRDLKTENIMMTKDWTLKIADFGYSTLKVGNKNNNLLDSFLGTLSYAAPEILRKKPYNGEAIDIFSSGVILFVITTGKLPFLKAVINDDDYRDLATKDFESFWNKKDIKIGKTTDEFKSLISLMLSHDPMERPNISEILEHPWMKLYTPSRDEMIEEFNTRDKVVKHLKELEQEEEKRSNERLAKLKNKTDNKDENRVYKGKENEKNQNIIEYIDEGFKGKNSINSSSKHDIKSYKISYNNYKFAVKNIKPKNFFNKLIAYFSDEDVDSNNKNYVSKGKKHIIVNKSEFELRVIYKHSKELLESLKNIKLEELEIRVELKKVENSKNLICELFKNKGDKMEFYEVFNNCVDYFEGSS